MTVEQIRVLVADDSGFMQLLIKDILSADKTIKVVATAENGKQALEKTKYYQPDVILMDMLMPKYDGLYGVEMIMQECPAPVVILSTVGNDNIGPILTALNLGAFDYLNKPQGNTAKLRTIDSEIVKKVRQAAKVDVKKLVAGRAEVNHLKHTFTDQRNYDIIVIGSSTGGPNALERIITKFPRNLIVPVIIAQHMPANFVNSFARRLNLLVPHEVLVAEKRMPIEDGKIYIAPGDRNMILRKNKASGKVVVDFVDKVYEEYNNPSINSLMLSVAELYGSQAIAVILTGMGRDGTEGMKAIKAKGGYAVAQDRESSVVFGMPKEAIASGCVDRVVAIDEMGEFIISCLS
ncbi:chemotaxis-specific protein-glutamate methyltransferase CheB [Reichenbachiella sp.]|uniref:chemotaxis-specific protein-glutamate methyltransferase CheB n=1 Tax=Reichenbachiella sp. TaxID=2184521 RepID=UPI00329A6401